uniref:Putative secreted protein n=1 Tax=Anopheles darlingi TaxID=43151 RepID=A0A2M4DPV5_ANODA
MQIMIKLSVGLMMMMIRRRVGLIVQRCSQNQDRKAKVFIKLSQCYSHFREYSEVELNYNLSIDFYSLHTRVH